MNIINYCTVLLLRWQSRHCHHCCFHCHDCDDSFHHIALWYSVHSLSVRVTYWTAWATQTIRVCTKTTYVHTYICIRIYAPAGSLKHIEVTLSLELVHMLTPFSPSSGRLCTSCASCMTTVPLPSGRTTVGPYVFLVDVHHQMHKLAYYLHINRIIRIWSVVCIDMIELRSWLLFSAHHITTLLVHMDLFSLVCEMALSHQLTSCSCLWQLESHQVSCFFDWSLPFSPELPD